MRTVTAADCVCFGSRVQFDGKSTSWLVRAETPCRRYTLLTAAMFGRVYYTVIDWRRQVRGPVDVIGWGLGIESITGPDPAIDEAIKMLSPGEFEVSRRGDVPLRITSVRGGR